MGKTLYQNNNGSLEPISWMPFVSATEAELEGKTYPKGTIIHVTDGEDFTEITQNDITLADGVTNAEFYVQKQGHIVTLSGRFNFACGSSGTKRIATMPSGYRPKNFREVSFFDNSKDLPMAGRITSDGILNMYSTDRNALTNVTFYVSATYFVQ